MMICRLTTLGLVLLACVLTLPVMAGEFPDDYYFDRPDEHKQLEGKDAPALEVGEWIGEEFKSEDLKGKIVIIDFWATWCGPCIAAMPHNTELAKKYAEQGVKLIGVCVSGDPEQMPKIVNDNGAKYPNAFAKGQQIEKDWPIQWYPTYAVVDRQGVVRAIGLNPNSIEDVLETLLEEDASATGKVRIKSSWKEGDEEKRARLKELEAQAASPPALTVENWINSEAIKLEELKGKVVVLDFWATWAGPSIRKIAFHNELVEKYGKDGFVLIGISATYGGEAMADIVKEHGIKYPVCVDVDNKTNTAYGPNGFPDYYVIDKAGKLRIADCSNETIEEAIKALLAEKLEDAEAKAEVEQPATDTPTQVPPVVLPVEGQ